MGFAAWFCENPGKRKSPDNLVVGAKNEYRVVIAAIGV